MSKRLGITIVAVFIALGVAFLALDILDIFEDFRFHFPANVLNTIFITAVALVVAYLAGRNYLSSKSYSMLWLGCGALAFGAGIIFKSWLPSGSLNASITVFEISVLLSAALNLIGAVLCIKQPDVLDKRATQKPGIVLASYLGVLGAIAIITALAYRNVFPPFSVSGGGTSLMRDIISVTGIFLFFAASAIYFSLYRKRRTAYLYWYSLALLLFSMGLFFLSQSAIESRLYWLGYISLYAGGVYLVVALKVARRSAKS